MRNKNRTALARAKATTKRSRLKKFSRNLLRKVEIFSAVTTLHGFKYVFEKDKSLAEKIFWISVLVFVFVLCAFQTYELIDYWNKGEILLTQETTKLNVWDVPFPAITLCSDYQVNATRLDNIKQEINNTDERSDVKDFADMMCFNNLFGKLAQNDISETALQYSFKHLAQSCESLIIRIRWINDALPNPCSYLQPVILSSGICYSLNMVPMDQLFHRQYAEILSRYSVQKYFHAGQRKQNIWSVESAYKNRDNIIPPWRVGGDGIHDAVKFAVDLRSDNFKHYCGISSSGLTIILHNPIDYPNPTSNQYIRQNVYSLILINPQIVAASDSLRTWNPVTRGCYYQDEKPLRFFKIYTLNNCELECRANKTLELCGCVTFYYPRGENTSVCGLSNRTCVSLAASTRFSVFDANNGSNGGFLRNNNCDCLPSCLELTYDSQVTEIVKDWSKMEKVDPRIVTKQIAVVNIYFRKKSADYWIRSPMIRFNELVANVGGVMSLCIGCSIVSVFEVLYFFVLQRWLQKPKNKEIRPDNRSSLAFFR